MHTYACETNIMMTIYRIYALFTKVTYLKHIQHAPQLNMVMLLPLGHIWCKMSGICSRWEDVVLRKLNIPRSYRKLASFERNVAD